MGGVLTIPFALRVVWSPSDSPNWGVAEPPPWPWDGLVSLSGRLGGLTPPLGVVDRLISQGFDGGSTTIIFASGCDRIAPMALGVV
jgi:hypothetical protein